MNDEKKAPPRCQPGTGNDETMQDDATSSGQDGKRPFIPAWLDDARLSQAEFRLYCHLCRRADKNGIAWPSYQSIQDACGFSHKTVWRIVKELENRGMITKAGKPFGGSCRYRVFPIVSPGESLDISNSVTTGTIATPIVSLGEPLKAPQSFPSGNSNRSPEETPIVSPGEREGNPMKVLQLRESNTLVGSPPKEFALDAPETLELKGGPDATRGAVEKLADAVWQITPPKGRERSSKKLLHDALKKIPKPLMPSQEEILIALDAWGKSDSWTKSNGEYVPGIHRWINDRKWELIPEPATKTSVSHDALEAARQSLGRRSPNWSDDHEARRQAKLEASGQWPEPPRGELPRL